MSHRSKQRRHKIVRSMTATLVCIGFLATLLVPPAGAATEEDFYIHVNSPGSYCGYAHITIDTSQFSSYAYGQTIVKAGNPCVPGNTTGVQLPAGWLTVETFLRCMDGVTADHVVWDSGVQTNTVNTGAVSAALAGWNAVHDCGTRSDRQARVETHTFFYVYPGGWQNYWNTTHWLAAG